MNGKSRPTPERIMRFAWGYAPTLVIETALRFRVFDELRDASLTAEELAAKTGTSPRGMRTILDALVGFELLSRSGSGYALTPESAAFLVSSEPSYHGVFFCHTVEQLLPKWLRLSEAVQTGRPIAAANQEAAGAAFFAEFVESLFPLSYPAACQLGEHLRLAETTQPITVLDLASGSGVWGIALAHQSPRVHIHAVDWPNVLEVTKRVTRQHGLADRLTVHPGDLLQADFGEGHAVATLGHILHSEGAERSRALLRKTFAALAPGGSIAIMEFVPNDERTGPPQPLLFAVNMLINTDEGDTFTFREISGWLQEAGFANPRLLDVPAVSPLILATKPA